MQRHVASLADAPTFAERVSNRTDRHRLLQNTTVLSVWLSRCAAAGVPAIPARFSQDILVEDIFKSTDGEECKSVDAAAKWLKDGICEKEMWRWEQCAPIELKSVMGNGGVACGVAFCTDDPRLCDILYDCNMETTRIAIRPVWDIQRHAGYPVEFRVYVFGAELESVSNYYPQRDLPDVFMPQAKEAAALARRLYPHVGTPFTADFCYDGNGHVVFLEGGPPWGYGAHPCCFNPDKLTPERIVLAKEDGCVVEQVAIVAATAARAATTPIL